MRSAISGQFYKLMLGPPSSIMEIQATVSSSAHSLLQYLLLHNSPTHN